MFDNLIKFILIGFYLCVVIGFENGCFGGISVVDVCLVGLLWVVVF